MCLGEYFDGLRIFLERNDYKVLCRALSQRLQQDTKPADIREIRIRLEKHGEFYHPSCVVATAHGRETCFVLNVAVSEAGIGYIGKEYHNLIKLNNEFPFSFLPKVYGLGEVETEGRSELRMFLGQWFEAYHEFHISTDPSSGSDKILVWDDARGRFYLSVEQTVDLYRRAAGILTSYYNPETFEHISAWHHAAGDFVLRVDKGLLDVKLITVRNYTSLFPGVSDAADAKWDGELILQAMLIFLLNLSVRMRLDRLDGVGDIAWADRPAVAGTVAGFFESLAHKPRIAGMPDSTEACFRYYLSACSQQDLYELSKAALRSFNPQAPEVRVVAQHLNAHVRDLAHTINQVLNL